MSNYDVETIITIVILLSLSIVYVYLLCSPTQPHVIQLKNRNFIIHRDSLESFKQLEKEFKDAQSGKYSGSSSFSNYDDFNYTSDSKYKSEWGSKGHADDFFMDGYKGENKKDSEESNEPIVPSLKYLCNDGWISMRSEMNYKYLWMHTDENLWMGATATIDTPLHRKSFRMFPINSTCGDGGWVLLQEGDSEGFIMMVSPVQSAYQPDQWVVKIGSTNITEAKNDTQYHFLIEDEGYVLNKASMGFITVMPQSEYAVRGHSGGWDKNKPAGREYGSMMHFQLVNHSLVIEDIQKEEREHKESLETDKKYIDIIATYPKSKEIRVISFGLYGSKPKYTVGAIKNAELSKVYFPGWICRFYVTSDVPEEVVKTLKSMGSQIEEIPAGKGYASGMFWRFLVASDSTVDRYIIRDTDSRLNARDRMAVEDWIESKYPVHVMRDHVNHCIVMNGGMWGGTKDAVSFMKQRIDDWSHRDEYMADLHFLEREIWPDIKNSQIAHDSYCCDRFPNSRPFPTQRYMNYQHVGQVFDQFDNPRLMDIDGFIRGVPVPGSCRKRADWIYG